MSTTAPGGVEARDAVRARVLDPVAEDRRAAGAARAREQRLLDAVAVEDVVAEDHRAGLPRDEVAADDERLREAVRARLRGVRDVHAPLAAVAEELHEAGLLVGRRDDQDVADLREHQHRQRVVDERLVVDRQQLLADRQRDRMQARARASGENDALRDHEGRRITSIRREPSKGSRALRSRRGGRSLPALRSGWWASSAFGLLEVGAPGAPLGHASASGGCASGGRGRP